MILLRKEIGKLAENIFYLSKEYLKDIDKKLSKTREKHLVIISDNKLFKYNIINIIKLHEDNEHALKFYLDNKIIIELNSRIKCIFDRINNIHYVNDDFIEKIKIINENFRIEKAKLIINRINNDSVCITYIDSKKFANINIPYEEMLTLENTMKELRNEVDVNIIIGKQENSFNAINSMESYIKEFFLNKGIDLNISEDSFRRIDIIWNETNLFIPFESLSNHCIYNYIPIHPIIVNDKKGIDGISIVYSNELKFGKNEAYYLFNILERNNKVEYFAADLLRDYRMNIENSNIVHFITHGRDDNNTGSLIIGNINVSNLDLIRDKSLVFLNSCKAGSHTDGIVTSLLERNNRYIISTAFDIPDSGFTSSELGIELFYDIIDSDNIPLTYFFTQLISPMFRKYYRLFTYLFNKS